VFSLKVRVRLNEFVLLVMIVLSGRPFAPALAGNQRVLDETRIIRNASVGGSKNFHQNSHHLP
jgi:hypothetical protein